MQARRLATWHKKDRTEDNIRSARNCFCENFGFEGLGWWGYLYIARSVDGASHAYSAHRGSGSTVDRAYDIRDIYNAAAPIPREVPSPDANQFLGEIWQLVKDAIKSSGGKMVD